MQDKTEDVKRGSPGESRRMGSRPGRGAGLGEGWRV